VLASFRWVQDALALCSGSLPPWVHHLTAACPFLFPFETRRQYFHATAFGLSRALQRLQQQQSVDGTPVATDRDGREVRVGRLQRQKVRTRGTRQEGEKLLRGTACRAPILS
jgi:E3 ubiquitin-protein ligase TRIP12